MGQRSQIYIRWVEKADDNFSLDKNHLIAIYYQWCYGDRLVSRARHGLEYLRNMIERYDSWYIKNYTEEVRRYFDANFDMKTIQIGNNINEWFEDEKVYHQGLNFNTYVFHSIDNDDGKLFIDCGANGKIYYAFTNSMIAKPMTAGQYIEWQDYLRFYYDALSKQDPSVSEDTAEVIRICQDNCAAIKDIAELMSYEQLMDFINCDYVEG